MENPPEFTFRDGQCLHQILYLSECSSQILTLLVCTLHSISKLMEARLITQSSWVNSLWANSDFQMHSRLFHKYQLIMEHLQHVTLSLTKDCTVLKLTCSFTLIMILQQINTLCFNGLYMIQLMEKQLYTKCTITPMITIT